MKFRIISPCLVGPQTPDRYIDASFNNPVIHEIPDDTPLDHVSRTWEPLDAAAQAALRKLGVEKPIGVVDIAAPWPPATDAPGADVGTPSPGTDPGETRRT